MFDNISTLVRHYPKHPRTPWEGHDEAVVLLRFHGLFLKAVTSYASMVTVHDVTSVFWPWRSRVPLACLLPRLCLLSRLLLCLLLRLQSHVALAVAFAVALGVAS